MFTGIDLPEKYGGAELLLDYCRQAERSIMIAPLTSLNVSRSALEALCKGLLKKNNIRQELEEGQSGSLAAMVSTCLANNLFHDQEAADFVRKGGNKAVHINQKDNYLPVTERNVTTAKITVSHLYKIMQEAFGYTDEKYAFDELQIPFGDYEIDRAVPKSENEVIYGDYNYFVHNKKKRYLYLQIFPGNSGSTEQYVLTDRDNLVRDQIMDDRNYNPHVLPTITPYDLSVGSDRVYIGYLIKSDSMLLSEMHSPMTPKQALTIGIDLIEALEEMKRISSGIHHRNIQPGCIIITPNGKGMYMASLVNMEMAKVIDYEYTILPSIKKLLKGNIYLPRELRNSGGGDTQFDWEKVDLYSIAKVIVYCVAPDLVADEIDIGPLYDLLPEAIVDELGAIFDSSVNEISTPAEFKEILLNQLPMT